MTNYWYDESAHRCVEHLQDVIAANTTYIRNNQSLSGVIPITFTIDAQPDVPRTLTWSFDSHAQITAYTLNITGLDAGGRLIVETFTEANGWSGATSYAFSVITSIILAARTGTGSGDTMDIGVGSKIGVANRMSSVTKIKKNNAHMAAANYTVNYTYNTIDLSTGGAIGAGDDFTVWYF